MASSTVPVLFSPNGFVPNSDSGVLRLSTRICAGSQMNHHFRNRSNSVSSVYWYSQSEFRPCSQLPSLIMKQRNAADLVNRLHLHNLPQSSAIPSSDRPTRSWRPPRVKDRENEANCDDEILEDVKALQRALKTAINEEDYTLAVQLRDTIRAFRQNSEANVLTANARFYKVYCKGDFEAMQALWGTWHDVRCIHAGQPYIITGYEAIQKSWECLCHKTKKWHVTCNLIDIAVHVSGDTGYVSCAVSFTALEGKPMEAQIDTNVFVRVGDKWYLFSHHSTQVTLSDMLAILATL